jgi:hypothetical protein
MKEVVIGPTDCWEKKVKDMNTETRVKVEKVAGKIVTKRKCGKNNKI